LSGLGFSSLFILGEKLYLVNLRSKGEQLKKWMTKALRVRVTACVVSLAMALSFALPVVAGATTRPSVESTTTVTVEYVPVVAPEVEQDSAAPQESVVATTAEEVVIANSEDIALLCPENELFEELARSGDLRQWTAVRPQVFAGSMDEFLADAAIPSSINGNDEFFYFHTDSLNVSGTTVTNYRALFAGIFYVGDAPFGPLPVNIFRDFKPDPAKDWADGIVVNNSLHASDTNNFGMPIWDVTVLNQPISADVPCAVCGESPSICDHLAIVKDVQTAVVFPGAAEDKALYLDITIVSVPGEAPRVLGGVAYLTTLLPAEIVADYKVSDYDLEYLAALARTDGTWTLTLYLAALGDQPVNDTPINDTPVNDTPINDVPSIPCPDCGEHPDHCICHYFEAGPSQITIHLTVNFSANSPLPFPFVIEHTFAPGELDVYTYPGSDLYGWPTTELLNEWMFQWLPEGWFADIFEEFEICAITGDGFWTMDIEFFEYCLTCGDILPCGCCKCSDNNNESCNCEAGNNNCTCDNGETMGNDNGANDTAGNDAVTNGGDDNNRTPAASTERDRRRSTTGPKTGDASNWFAQVATIAALFSVVTAAGLVRTREQN
jgi:hypothetical protein